MILGKTESDKWFDFLEKLKDEVKVWLAGLLSLNECFDSITRKAIQVDQAMFNVDKARKKAAKSQNPAPASSQTPSRPPQQQPRNHPSSSSGGPRNPSSTGGSRVSSAAPGSVHTASSLSNPRPPLSDAEKQYREDNNLCRYCGSKDHFRKDCDKYKKKLEMDAKKGLPPRYPHPSSSNINAPPNPARPVTVSHIISPSGKYDPQGQ